MCLLISFCVCYRKAARASLVGKKGKRRTLSLDSSSEDGNEPTPCDSSPVPPSPSPGGGPREETSDVISIEKQKFFRGSAFYRGPKTEGGRGSTNHDRDPVITPVTPLTPFPQHVPRLLPSSYSDKELPFGSLGEDDSPWGFAAAALSAQADPAPRTSTADSTPHPPTIVPLLRKRKKDSIQPSPSSLVKTAVCCKSAELERRKQLNGGERSRKMEEATGRAGKVPPSHLPSRPPPLWSALNSSTVSNEQEENNTISK